MKQFGFKRFCRLNQSADFKRAYSSGSAIKNAYLSIYRVPNDVCYNRLGISIRNKICEHLAQRNRVKRIIRDIFRTQSPQFGSGMDIVVVVKKVPTPLTRQKLLTLILK